MFLPEFFRGCENRYKAFELSLVILKSVGQVCAFHCENSLIKTVFWRLHELLIQV